jgi:hypothetical protein
MQDDEVADALHFKGELGVEGIARDLCHRPAGQEFEQARNAGLDEMDRGRFQRFEKARGQADGDDIGLPRPRRRPVVKRIGRGAVIAPPSRPLINSSCTASSEMKSLQ